MHMTLELQMLRQLEMEINKCIEGYPSNHVYCIERGRFCPQRQLAERLKYWEKQYLQPMESMLDIGCCKGGFLFHTALRCPQARLMGIDLANNFIEVCREVADYLNQRQICFRHLSLEELYEQIECFGGAFQNVLLINTYHYLYYGSRREGLAYKDHERIFAMLAGITRDQLLFSSPLEPEDCPSSIAKQATRTEYSAKLILAAASQYFDLSCLGKSGHRPVYRMQKRG